MPGIGEIMDGWKPKGSSFGAMMRQQGVRATAEFNRVLNLPVRDPTMSDEMAERLSRLLHRPGGKRILFNDQALALKEISQNAGTFIAMEVGSGKAGISLLAPVLRGSKRPLLLVPAGMRKPTIQDTIPEWREHFQLNDNLVVESYETLSSIKNGAQFLETLRPDHIICDEADKLKDLDTARGIRFYDYFRKYPETKLDALSGSFFDREVEDFLYILRLCLGVNTPLPFDDDEVNEWSCAVSANVETERRIGIGALKQFERFFTPEVWEKYNKPGQSEPERAMMCLAMGRMRVTPGIVFSSKPTVKIPIFFHEVRPSIPSVIRDHFERLKETWETPRGDEIKDAVHMYRTVCQLSQGYWYRWIWPNNTPDLIWLEARKRWHRYVRRTILRHETHHLHSYKPVEDACARWENYQLLKQYGDKAGMAHLSQTVMLDSQEYRNWQAVKGRYIPVKEVVWESKYLVDVVADWLDAHVGIAWTGSIPFGEAIRAKGFRYYRGGQNEIIYETVSCAASLDAHGRGKNLQAFFNGLVIDPPTRGRDWQQLLGRYSRTGQKSDQIHWWVCLHARELWSGFFQAGKDARYAQSAGQPQKLLEAISFLETDEEQACFLIEARDPLWRYPKRDA